MWRLRAGLHGIQLPTAVAVVGMSGFLVYRTSIVQSPAHGLGAGLYALASGTTWLGFFLTVGVWFGGRDAPSPWRRALAVPGLQILGATLCALGYQIGRRLERPFIYDAQALFILTLVSGSVFWTWLQVRGRGRDTSWATVRNAAREPRLLSILLVVLGVLAGSASLIPLLRIRRLEDVFITLRYGYHLATGSGIRWNAADPSPTEGYTTFLWMLLGAVAERLADHPFVVLQVASSLSLVVLAGLVFRAGRDLWGLSRWTALLPPAVMVAGPAMPFHGASGMETLFFAVTVIVLSWSALHWSRQPSRRMWPVLLGLATLISGWVRPEGLIYGGVLIAMVAAMEPRRIWLCKPATTFLLTLFLPGAIYFLWRLAYFGHFLPNSFHHKQSGITIWAAAARDVMHTDFLALVAIPYLAMIGYGLSRGRLHKEAWLFVLPAVCCIAYYTRVLPISGNEYRFFIAFLPPLVVASASELARLVTVVAGRWRVASVPIVLTVWVIVSLAPYTPTLQGRYEALASGARYDESRSIYMTLGRVLQGLPADVVVGLGEVGKIGYLLRDRTLIDLLGLNDSYLARHAFSGRYLDQRQVQVVAVPAYPGGRQGLYGMVYRSIGDHFSELDDRFVCVGGVDDHFRFDIFVRRGPEDRIAELSRALAEHIAFQPGRCLSVLGSGPAPARAAPTVTVRGSA